MKHNSLIVLMEDSSKAKFGGGQAVSLTCLETLSKYFRVAIIDHAKQSVFFVKAKELSQYTLSLFNYGKITKAGKQSFNVSLLEIFLTVIYIPLNLIRIYFFLEKIRERKEDVLLFAMTKKTLLICYLLNLLFKYKYSFYAHSVDDSDSNLFKVVKISASNSSQIICVSKAVAKNFQDLNHVVLYNYIENPCHELIRKNEVPRHFKIGFIGSLIAIKSVETLIMAHNEISNTRNDICLKVFGDGSELASYKRIANASVEFPGFVKDKSKIYSNIDILVLPSKIAEACPMVVLEAFGYGIPVIVSNLGGQKELIELSNAGLTFNVGDYKDLAKKIIELKENAALYDEFRKNAISFAANMNLDKYQQNLLRAIKEI